MFFKPVKKLSTLVLSDLKNKFMDPNENDDKKHDYIIDYS